MRISTNTIFEAGINRISDLQVALAKTQQQLSTNSRILSPSDDPVGAAHALDVSQAQAINTQFTANRQTAKSQLSTVETTLSSITDLLTSVKSTVIGAGNASLDDTQRGFLASQLQGNLDQLIGLANTSDANGHHIFSGFQTGTAPFIKTATGAIYQGDQGRRMIQVSSSRQISMSDSGDSIFQSGGQDVFKTLTDLVTLLNTPTTTPAASAALTAGLATANTGIQNAMDAVMTTRSSVGTRLNELTALDTEGSARDLQYAQSLSDYQDLDYAKAISQLSQQQMTLEAAQKSFVSITGLSLFKLL